MCCCRPANSAELAVKVGLPEKPQFFKAFSFIHRTGFFSFAFWKHIRARHKAPRASQARLFSCYRLLKNLSDYPSLFKVTFCHSVTFYLMLPWCGGVQQNRPPSPISLLAGHYDIGKASLGTPAVAPPRKSCYANMPAPLIKAFHSRLVSC